jgi:hypothetical protein
MHHAIESPSVIQAAHYRTDLGTLKDMFEVGLGSQKPALRPGNRKSVSPCKQTSPVIIILRSEHKALACR